MTERIGIDAMVVNLTQPATVFWVESVTRPPGHRAIGTGIDRRFGALDDAVRFVIEEIPTEFRSAAWIETASGSLSAEEIVALYGSIRRGAAAPKIPTMPDM